MTTTSWVEIANRAFDAIEHRGFKLPEDGSKEADAAGRHYEPARRYVLVQAPWKFATVFHEITATVAGETAPDATPHVSVLPPDCLKVIGFPDYWDDANPPRWRTGADRRLFSEIEPPYTIAYTRDEDDTSRFSPEFETGLVLWLSHLLAPKFNRSANRAEIQLNYFIDFLASDTALDAMEQSAPDYAQEGAYGDWSLELAAVP